mmetsp:Transcript_20688/g.70358  ORF Transcript_20688/g.70358 Transcript_20688/m.70358 type:complete len:251 (-) Transcript_20688:35-787(-)
MYFERSIFFTRSPTFFSTSSLRITTSSSPPPALSGASKLSSSTTRSSTVCSRLAPMLSTFLFTSADMLAIALTASSSKRRSTPSVRISACCCLIMLCVGSVSILYRSSSSRPLRFTRTGSLPCSSASMSLGLHWLNAPLAMKSMCCVLTLPYLVETVVPSITGRRSRCTPSDDASALCMRSPALTILSISSMNTIPSLSAAATASFVTTSTPDRRSVSCSSSRGRASATVNERLSGRVFSDRPLNMVSKF